jgi:hypothetical protein
MSFLFYQFGITSEHLILELLGEIKPSRGGGKASHQIQQVVHI